MTVTLSFPDDAVADIERDLRENRGVGPVDAHDPDDPDAIVPDPDPIDTWLSGLVAAEVRAARIRMAEADLTASQKAGAAAAELKTKVYAVHQARTTTVEATRTA